MELMLTYFPPRAGEAGKWEIDWADGRPVFEKLFPSLFDAAAYARTSNITRRYAIVRVRTWTR